MKRLLAVLFVLPLAVSIDAREGFGFKKKAVEMMRTIPPSTNAGARRVKVTVTSDRGDARDDARTLDRYLTEAILSGAGTLAEGGKPEVTIHVSLDRVESHETWETKTEYVRQQTGTKRKWNEKKQKYEEEPIYSSVPVQKQVKVVTASVSGSYDIGDRTDDVASGDLTHSFRETYGDDDNAPAPSEIEDDLLRRASKQIAAHIVPTQDRVNVLVPRATFEPLIPLAESGAWDRYLTAVEAVPANRNPKDEAFRQYALAIAKEALAYQSENRAEATGLLRAAASHYQLAATSNPGEELFRKGYVSLLSANNIGAPIARVNDSVTKFEAWSGPGSAPAVRVAQTSASEPPAKPAKQGMRNQTVIDLAKAGLSDENIVLAIDGAERTDFDVTPDALIALAKGGVSKSVIAHMQKKSAKR
ncbi:MAG TPA: hypothetical protein VEK57_13170 [Thermoanaerobaculia bacterium]|nr:hypothetical protein [Thermoanaerobaculia bacterium]